MSRLTRRLSGSTFDLAVVGGGIHGLFAALEAAGRGWTVALFERDDFGSGLSSNHQRTVHGGLRALQSGRVSRTRQQIAERHAWAVMAPHLLHPLAFLFPTHPDLRRSRLAIGAAFRLYDWLGRDRNVGLPPALQLPPSRIATREATLDGFPGLIDDDVTGGAIWYDYQVRHPDRLNWLVALAAQRAGAVLFNHSEVTGLTHKPDRMAELQVRDVIAGEDAAVTARRVLICAGGGAAAIHARLGLSPSTRLVRASSLLIRRPALATALAARGASGRVLTATPWAGHWLVGTFQPDSVAGAGADPRPSRAEVDAMIDEANGAFATLQIRRRDVVLVHSGLTPAIVRRGRAELTPESVIIAHATATGCEVHSIVGVKFTTARLTALEALARLGLRGRPGNDATASDAKPALLPHGSAEGADAVLRAACLAANVTLDDDVRLRWLDWYGTEAADVFAYCAASNRLQRLAPDCPALEGELLYVVEHAHALTLADAVLRRTGIGAAGHPGRVALDRSADILTQRFGWSADARAGQVRLVEARYEPGLSGDV